MNRGFTLVCKDCQEHSEMETKDKRLTEKIKILHHFSGVRLYCAKCEQQLILE